MKGTTIGSMLDSPGHFLVRHLPPGPHAFTFQPPGHEVFDTAMPLREGDALTFNIGIHPDGPIDDQNAILGFRKGEPRLLIIGGIARLTVQQGDLRVS